MKILLLFISLSGFAQSSKPLAEKDLRDFQSKVKSHSSLSIDFEQKVFRSLRKKTSTSTGVAHFQKPNHFHWMLTAPHKSHWIFDGKALFNFEDQDKTISRYPSGSSKAQELNQVVDMILNFDVLMNHHTMLKAEQLDSIVSMEIAPKHSTEMTKALLEYDQKLEFVRMIRLFFKGDNNTTFQFSNPRPLKDPASAFALPKGLNVVDAL